MESGIGRKIQRAANDELSTETFALTVAFAREAVAVKAMANGGDTSFRQKKSTMP
jgi:hypothetical protein